MKLRRLSAISLAASLIGLLGLAAFSVVAVNLLANHMQQAERVTQVRAQVEEINVALDYVTLLRSDAAILRALSKDAKRLAELIQELDHPLSNPAAIHLNELAHLARMLGELSPDTSLLHSDQQQRDTLMAVVKQVLIHRAGVTDVINTMASEQRETLYLQVMATEGALVTGALLIAVLSMFGFTVLHHRLSKPMDALEQGLRAVAAGDLDARIDIRGRDELAQLGTLFNQMVSQRQVHESELAEKEQRFRQLAENIDEVFWMTDPEKQELLYISPAFEHIWGISPDALYQDPAVWLQAIHPDDRDRVRQALPEQAAGTYREEYRITRADGMERCILDRAFPIRDASGQVYRIAGVALDLTDRRQMQADLQKRVKELGCIYRVLELTTDTQRDARSICADVTAVLPDGFLESGHAVARITM
ncbi:MAG TPA: PAS domain-containing protein, partial [Thioalkalivibrio sp.]|nr:PAS domain-containing protein [Thioalkalivibrio sp.]